MVLILGFAIDSDAAVSIAKYAAIGSGLFVLLTILSLFVLRISHRSQRSSRRRTIKKWRPILHEVMAGNTPRKLPYLIGRARLYFLEYWNYIHESVSGPSRDRLNAMARTLKLDRTAHKNLRSGYLWRQLLGITTLGALRDPAAQEPLHKFAESEDPVLSVTAFRALLRIDPTCASRYTAAMTDRHDWAEAKIASFLHESDPSSFDEHLAAAIRSAGTEKKARLIRLAYALKSPLATAATHEFLMQNKDHRDDAALEGAAIAGLRVLSTESDLSIARSYLAHPSWPVRKEAIASLARIIRPMAHTDPEDRKRLEVLLRDPHWWVRYESAKALASMPGFSTKQFQEFEEHQQDPVARDVLRHVIAERQFA